MMREKWMPSLVSVSALFLSMLPATQAQVYRGGGTSGQSQSSAVPTLPLEMPRMDWVDVKLTLERQESELRRQQTELIGEAGRISNERDLYTSLKADGTSELQSAEAGRRRELEAERSSVLARWGRDRFRCPKGYGYYECEQHQDAKARWDAQRAAALAEVDRRGTSFDRQITRSSEKIQLASQELQRLDNESRSLQERIHRFENLTQRHNAGELWLNPAGNSSEARISGTTRFSYDQNAAKSTAPGPRHPGTVAGPPAPLPPDRVTGLDYHVGPPVRHDSATASENLRDAAAGHAVQRSRYGNAPGGSVHVNQRMQDALSILSSDYRFRITEIAGGSHGHNSRHYQGNAVDIDQINGVPINAQTVNTPSIRQFRTRVQTMGATVIGPGDDPAHATHLHVQWPAQPPAPTRTTAP